MTGNDGTEWTGAEAERLFVPQEDISGLVAAWHEAPAGSAAARQGLAGFLGMTWGQYRQWVQHPADVRPGRRRRR
jgi:hypothetical protein